jgi:hypothetical protein
MKTIFDITFVSEAEYSYYNQLNSLEQLHYFFELYDSLTQRSSTSSLDLSSFFAAVKSSLDSSTDEDTVITKIPDDRDRVDVIIDDENILIESNSLRSIKHITMKFIESGYILRRDVELEKTFCKDKITRYLRVFQIISQVSTLCFN